MKTVLKTDGKASPTNIDSECHRGLLTCKRILPRENENGKSYRLYTQRWFILAAYCFLTITALSQATAFTAISNILQRYYHTNLIAINWLSMIYFVIFVLFAIPCSFMFGKYGLSILIVIAAFINALAAIIRYLGGTERDGYWPCFIGHSVGALSVSAFQFLPPKIAAMWFGDHERATATGIAVAADALGLGLGFVQSTAIIRNHQEVTSIRKDMNSFLLSAAIQGVIIFMFVCIVVRRDKPPSPPSLIGEESDDAEIMTIKSFAADMKSLMKNLDFQLILNIHGLLWIEECIRLILLNELVIPKFPGKEFQVGLMGAFSQFGIVITNLAIGPFLDKTKSYRNTTIVLNSISTILIVAFIVVFQLTTWFYLLFVLHCLTGMFSSAYYTIAFDHGAEMTYPISEGSSGAILLVSGNLYGLTATYVTSVILYKAGPIPVFVIMSVIYGLSSVLALSLKDKGPRSLFNESINLQIKNTYINS